MHLSEGFWPKIWLLNLHLYFLTDKLFTPPIWIMSCFSIKLMKAPSSLLPHFLLLPYFLNPHPSQKNCCLKKNVGSVLD